MWALPKRMGLRGCEPNAVGLESHDPPAEWSRAKSLLDHD
jgi:hypothetical protein